MDFLLVFPLVLVILSTGQSNAQVTSSCLTQCPPGFHKNGPCGDSLMTCKECDNDTFTEIPNSIEKCQRCRHCGHYEKAINPCSRHKDTECDCKDEYYNASNYSDRRDCQQCPSKEEKANRVKHRGAVYHSIWERCLKNPDCQRKCNATSSNSTTPAIKPPRPNTTDSATSTSASNSTDSSIHKAPFNPLHHISLLFFAVPMAVFLALFCILLLFNWNPSKYPDSCPCCLVSKAMELPVEEPMLNDQCSHQVDSPTTQTLIIAEETPMMPLNQSPAPSEDSAHVSPVLPNAEHKAARQDEQTEHWPAIVLYAIIKEVPLRRWKEFLRLLSVADQQLERVELEAGFGLGSMERQYQMLRLWSQRSTSSLDDVFSALHYMDLSGCAQLLQESLEKLQWRPELKHGCTDHGTMLDT